MVVNSAIKCFRFETSQIKCGFCHIPSLPKHPMKDNEKFSDLIFRHQSKGSHFYPKELLKSEYATQHWWNDDKIMIVVITLNDYYDTWNGKSDWNDQNLL